MNVAPTPLHSRRAQQRSQLALIAGVVVLAAGLALLVRHDFFQGSSGSHVIQGSGVAATQTRNLAGFSSVDLAGSNNVTVQVGGRQAVVVRADDNLLGRITTEVRARTLVIGNTGSIATRSPTSIEITVPSLTALTLSGSGNVVAHHVRARRLTVTLSGSGVLRATGTVTRLDVSLGGSGDEQLGQLVAREVHATVSGSGRIVVDATNTLDAAVSGSGAIVYGGNPAHVTTRISGSGAVTRE